VTKPFFEIDIASNAQSSLEAHLPLALMTDEGCFHNSNNLRMPLGIYNISISRVCDKLVRLCQRLEIYFRALNTLEPLQENDEVMQEIIDYIELSLYAATEHVDDIDSIASGFFKNLTLRNKNTSYKTLQKEIKKHKCLVSAAANAIKHQQSRIRMFSMEFLTEDMLATCTGTSSKGWRLELFVQAAHSTETRMFSPSRHWPGKLLSS